MNESQFTVKKDISPNELLRFGFVPKYDEDTGEIKEYRREFVIQQETSITQKRHFTFILRKDWHRRGFKKFEYSAWMTGFNWDDVTTAECMQFLYDLIIGGIVEPAEDVKGA